MVAVRWYLRYGLSYRDVEDTYVVRLMRSPRIGRSRCSNRLWSASIRLLAYCST